MPFLPSSRYSGTELVEAPAGPGRTVTAVKLRRLPSPPAAPYVVDAEDRLDTIAHRDYGDATHGWHVADANSELDARALMQSGKTIDRPGQP